MNLLAAVDYSIVIKAEQSLQIQFNSWKVEIKSEIRAEVDLKCHNNFITLKI